MKLNLKNIKIVIKSTLIIALTLLLFITDGCKKYEDGPSVSFRSKKQRLIGIWSLKTFSVNNIDSTFYYNQSFNTIRFEFLDKTEENDILINFVNSRKFCELDLSNGAIMGEWDFLDNEKKLSLRFIDWGFILGGGKAVISGFGPFGTSKISKWYIKKLTNEELVIVTTYNIVNYEIKLKKH